MTMSSDARTVRRRRVLHWAAIDRKLGDSRRDSTADRPIILLQSDGTHEQMSMAARVNPSRPQNQ
jgi:hypothetical protein